jgi:YVTN family beta-propeller protein
MDSSAVLMTRYRAALLGLLAVLLVLWTACGDTFRPVAIPLSPTPPSPSSFYYVLALSQNGVNNAGASTRIDVSGDSNVGVAQLGIAPVYAALVPSGNNVYIANSLDDTVSSYALGSPATVNTTTLEPGSTPIFIATADNATVYVANAGNGTVGAINTSNNALANSIAVGFNPVSIIETPDASKIYAVGGGAGVVSINASDKSVNPPISDPSISSPVWVLSRSDSRFVYVLNSGNGTVTPINTSDDSVEAAITVSSAPGANFMVYDKALQRLYVTNPNTTQVGVVDVSTDQPTALRPLDLTAVPAGTSAICTSGCSPESVAVLPDGSRAYVATYSVSGTTMTSQVTVFNTQTEAVRTVLPTVTASVDTTNATGCGNTAIIPTPGVASVRFRLFAVAALGGSRVYVANCDAGNTEIIQTTDDTPSAVTIPAPLSSFPVSAVGGQPPLQNPVFLLSEPF